MPSNKKRLIELGMVPALANELARQIDGAAKNVNRLTESSAIPRVAREMVRQMTAVSGDARRFVEMSVPPRLAREMATQIGGGTPTPTPTPGVARSLPGFTTDGSLPGGILFSKAGGVVTDNYNPANYRQSGTRIYVRETGNDSTGTGTIGAPFRQVAAALAVAVNGSIIDIGPGRFNEFTDPADKALWYVGVTGATFIGRFLAAADVTMQPIANDRHQITVNAGGGALVAGFVDTTLMDAEGAYKSALVATTAAGVATLQNRTYESAPMPFGGVFRNTTTGAIGAADKRDLTGKLDSEIILYSSTAPAPIVLAPGTASFCENLIFVGGAIIACATGATRNFYRCSHLGCFDSNMSCDGGTSILWECQIRGSGLNSSDIMDYGANAKFIEGKSFILDCGYGGSDNCSTAHGSLFGARYKTKYGRSIRPVYDGVGAVQVYMYECPITSGPNGPTSYHLAAGSGSTDTTTLYVEKITFSGTVTGANVQIQAGTATRMVTYDNSFATATVEGSANVIDWSANYDPTVQKTFILANGADLSKVLQADNTTPVSADGQTVGRVILSDAGDYFTGTDITYKTDGTLRWFLSGTTPKFVTVPSVGQGFEGNMCITMTVDAVDTQAVLMSQGTTTDYLDARNSTGTVINKGSRWGVNSTFRVNKVAVANQANTLNAAMLTGGVKTFTMKNVNLEWSGWLAAVWLALINNTVPLSGKIFDIRVYRYTTDADMFAQETASAARGGLVI